ncbi:MAG: DUF1643 domain-containing protein [Pseudomonadota bacterium]
MIGLIDADATFSDCGLYRYSLSRQWDRLLPTAVFILLNPSTADARQDDPTVRRCRGFATRDGCGGLVMVNLFAYRATSPAEMMAADDPIGPDNDRYIADAIDDADGPVVCAWGNHGVFRSRDHQVATLSSCIDAPLFCLGLTKAGSPRHPLYLSADTPLERL